MKPRTALVYLIAILLSAGTAGAAAGQTSAASVERDVRAVVETFRSALETGDSTTVVSLFHPDARIYEAGHAETLDEYRSGHLRGDIAFLSAVSSETLREDIVPGDRVALYTSEKHTTGEVRGRQIDSTNAETIVLVRTDDGWKIRHIHWSSR